MGKADLFAGRLKELRAAADLSLKELAERAGITPDAVVKLESGNRKPAWETVVALADALGVECTAFLREGNRGQVPKRPRGRPRKASGAAQEPRPGGRASGSPGASEGPAKGKAGGKGQGKGKAP
jgi:transcriptional regulator with XRE-family HTH domain